MYPSTLDLLIGLSDAAHRLEAAHRLSKHLGVEETFLFVTDTVLGVPVPAAGMRQTLPGGRAWRRFVAGCVQDGEHVGQVDLPASTLRSATAFVACGAALILVGGRPNAADTAAIRQLLPLLAAVFVAEHQLTMAATELALAKEAAQRANTLSMALESARSEASRLNIQLRREDQQKDEFLAMLAHELRNPLAGVQASIQLLRRAPSTHAQSERAMTVIERQTGQLAKLVDDLMDTARVSQGRIELWLEPLSLQKLLLDAVEINRHLLDAKGHTLLLSLSPEPLTVDGDAVRLTQVFSNLLHNAIKYTDAEGKIELTARRDGSNALVEITDTGIGIEAEMLPTVFQLFKQAPVAIDRSQGGLGIGLTLVEKLLALHGGSVVANSGGKGQGSTFTVRMALREIDLPLKESSSAVASRQTLLQILVVDDNEDAAQALAELLRLDGHTVDLAYSGEAALERVAQASLDLVLLDLGLPDIDGYEVARRIRTLRGGGLRLAAVTGYGGEAVHKKAIDAGFDAHCVKPLSFEALAEVIRQTRSDSTQPGCSAKAG